MRTEQTMRRLPACVLLPFALALWLMPTPGRAADTLKLTVEPSADGAEVPVRAVVTLPKDLADVPPEAIRVDLKAAGGASAPGQILPTDGGAELWWILPEAKAGAPQTWTATLTRAAATAKDGFLFQDEPGEHLDLLLAGRKTTRYIYAFDTSTAARKAATWKTYHHVFDLKGDNVITQGAGGSKYPHHRGIFIGGRVQAATGTGGDFWHGQTQIHQGFLQKTAGPVVARSTALIHWKSGDKLALVEKRETTAYCQALPTMLLLDFRSQLSGPDADVALGGDREHGGVQFRAHGDIDEAQTRYQFPADDTEVTREVDLPWTAMSFVLRDRDGQRYGVQHMNHPDNPKNTQYSAYRTYGWR